MQTRTDLVCRHPDLLEAWRPLAKDFDIFFGLEAASDEGLASVVKDAGVKSSASRRRGSARALGYGVTGNFLVDPDWEEWQFRELWDFVDDARLRARRLHDPDAAARAPSSSSKLAPRLEGQPWFKYDMHHVLWEPRLGAKRFFELYAETWRRSILNTSGQKSWIDWMRQVRPAQIPYLTRVLCAARSG